MPGTAAHQLRSALLAVPASLLLIGLAGCSGNSTDSGSEAQSSASSAVSSASAAASSARENADQAVDCSGTSCSITLTGGGAQVDVLGTTLSFDGVQNGQATVRVGDRSVSCGEGDEVSAGPLTLECTTVSEDTVTLKASLG